MARLNADSCNTSCIKSCSGFEKQLWIEPHLKTIVFPVKTKNLRVLSLNIHKGFSHFNFNFALSEIRNAIRESQADVVLLQEVRGQDVHRPEVSSQFEFLADTLWTHYAYGKNAVYPEGHHGNAILSKYPIESWNNLNLSTNRFESRGLLHAKIFIPDLGAHLDCLTLHLNLLGRDRFIQIQKIIEYMRVHIPNPSAFLMAGDFNDWDQQLSPVLQNELHSSEAFEVLHGRPAKTFPNFWPLLALDRMYFRMMKPMQARVIRNPSWKFSSDHAALLVDFSLGYLGTPQNKEKPIS